MFTYIVTLLPMQVHSAHFSFNLLTHTHKAIHVMINLGDSQFEKTSSCLVLHFCKRGHPLFPCKTVLLHNGGFLNACTLKRSITFWCITKQSTSLYVAII
jgi:hypothetical protein